MTKDTETPAKERQRDADRSQGVIFSAARDEFAEHGLGGARMDRIAERAGLNKRLIYYYFEDKEKLFQAVLEQAYLHIREEERKLNLLELAPATAIRRLVEFTWTYYLENPQFLTLLNSANLHKARHLQESQRAREMNSPLIATLAEVLERGRSDGSFRGGWTRCSCTCRLPGCHISICRTTTPCRPSSAATSWRPRRATSGCRTCAM